MIACGTENAAGQTKSAGSKMLGFLAQIVSLISVKRMDRRLRLCEMLSLGEKRFVAVVEYGSKTFLLAGTPQNISLLHRLDRDLEAPGDLHREGMDGE